jgi:uncharacterized protein
LDYVYIFSLFSILGWVLEFIYRSVRTRGAVNPGFLKGPYLPIYGAGAVILYIVIDNFQASGIFIRGLIYLLVTTSLELSIGYIFDNYFHKRLWDYSNQPFNVRGYVCLKYSICWVILAFVFEWLLLPFSLRLQGLLEGMFMNTLLLIVLSVMLIDGVDAFYKSIRAYRKRKSHTRGDAWQEFSGIAGHLTEHPDVDKLSRFRHHSDVNRLEHSLEVAWISYLLAKRLSLDHVAVVRGAILHDLFFYDWWHEGPRLHGIYHPRISLKNAKEITALSSKEKDIIKKHMWPLTLFPPRYMESWIVCLVDTYCTIKDYFMVLKCL